MDIKKAIKLCKEQDMLFSDIMELCNLENSQQMYVIDYGVRNKQPDWKIESVASKVNDSMLAAEIQSLFGK